MSDTNTKEVRTKSFVKLDATDFTYIRELDALVENATVRLTTVQDVVAKAKQQYLASLTQKAGLPTGQYRLVDDSVLVLAEDEGSSSQEEM